MTQKPILTFRGLDLSEYPDFESCLTTYLDGSPNVEPRVFESLLATVISGFRYNDWSVDQWLSFVKNGGAVVNRLAYAAIFYFGRCYPMTPGENTAKQVFENCQQRLVDPWPELYIGNFHRPNCVFAEEAHVYANIILLSVHKKINWDMDKYSYTCKFTAYEEYLLSLMSSPYKHIDTR